jgi:Excalibur calcium-binding domain
MSAPLRTRLSGFAAALSGALVVAMAGTALAAEDPVSPAGTRPQASVDDGEESDVAADAPATTPAVAHDDEEDSGCSDFTTQAGAQAALVASRDDREHLDTDDDGIACEEYFGTEGRQVAVFPQGGVAAGGAT